MPLANEGKRKELTREERRERRLLRREKQRKDNIGRAAKMHAARLKMESENHKECEEALKASAYVGCSGWFYWKWRGMYYPEDLPTSKWFDHYAKRLDTVEINASFYSWPTVAGVKAWRRQAGRRKFVYTVKVCELITHIKRFQGTKTLIKDFGMIADILGDRMGCFLFQLPPNHRFTKARLAAILGQLDPARRNVVEFRHISGETRWSTQHFERPAQFSALAAGRDSRMSLCGLQTRSTRVSTDRNVGTATITRKTNFRSGRTELILAARKERGFTSI
jgi:hypothetical protein